MDCKRKLEAYHCHHMKVPLTVPQTMSNERSCFDGSLERQKIRLPLSRFLTRALKTEGRVRFTKTNTPLRATAGWEIFLVFMYGA